MLRRGKPGTQFSRTWRKIGQAWVVFPLSFHLVDLVVSRVKLAQAPIHGGEDSQEGRQEGSSLIILHERNSWYRVSADIRQERGIPHCIRLSELPKCPRFREGQVAGPRSRSHLVVRWWGLHPPRGPALPGPRPTYGTSVVHTTVSPLSLGCLPPHRKASQLGFLISTSPPP